MLAIGGLAILVLALGWLVYVRQYNAHYDSPLFLTSIRPIWMLSYDEIHDTLAHLCFYARHEYFPECCQFIPIALFVSALIGGW